jgi:hypothetical protein
MAGMATDFRPCRSASASEERTAALDHEGGQPRLHERIVELPDRLDAREPIVEPRERLVQAELAGPVSLERRLVVPARIIGDPLGQRARRGALALHRRDVGSCELGVLRKRLPTARTAGVGVEKALVTAPARDGGRELILGVELSFIAHTISLSLRHRNDGTGGGSNQTGLERGYSSSPACSNVLNKQVRARRCIVPEAFPRAVTSA